MNFNTHEFLFVYFNSRLNPNVNSILCAAQCSMISFQLIHEQQRKWHHLLVFIEKKTKTKTRKDQKIKRMLMLAFEVYTWHALYKPTQERILFKWRWRVRCKWILEWSRVARNCYFCICIHVRLEFITLTLCVNMNVVGIEYMWMFIQ